MPDAEPPFRLMSYRALAEVWGCSLEAAQERVRRHKWRKQPGNSRQVLIAVPLHVLEETVGDADPRASMDLREEVRAQRERELQALRERAERARRQPRRRKQMLFRPGGMLTEPRAKLLGSERQSVLRRRLSGGRIWPGSPQKMPQ